MEESISRSAGAGGEMADEGELRHIIEDLGRRPLQRDTLYGAV